MVSSYAIRSTLKKREIVHCKGRFSFQMHLTKLQLQSVILWKIADCEVEYYFKWMLKTPGQSCTTKAINSMVHILRLLPWKINGFCQTSLPTALTCVHSSRISKYLQWPNCREKRVTGGFNVNFTQFLGTVNPQELVKPIPRKLAKLWQKMLRNWERLCTDVG